MRLDLTHSQAVRDLMFSNQQRTINGYHFEKGFAWIQRSFLAQLPQHFIFGSFHEGELVAMCCLILHFPFQSTAYIGNVFYKPKFIKERVKVLASEEAYRQAVESGCPSIYSCVLEKRYQSQWDLVQRYSDYMKQFSSQAHCQIAAGTYPQEEWLRFVLGYQIPGLNCTIRKAVFSGERHKAS